MCTLLSEIKSNTEMKYWKQTILRKQVIDANWKWNANASKLAIRAKKLHEKFKMQATKGKLIESKDEKRKMKER